MSLIKDVKNTFMGNLGSLPKGQNVSGSESFSKIFDKTQGNRQETDSTSVEVKTAKSETDKDLQKHSGIRNNKKTDELKETANEASKISEKEAMDQAAEEAGMIMVEETARTFGVTVEEVETVLEMLGLTALDLLNSESITQVALALNPGKDALSVVTDEQLFLDLKSLMNKAEDLVKELQSKFGLNDAEMGAFLEALNATKKAEELIATDELAVLPESEDETLMLTERKNSMVEVEVVKDTSLEAATALKTETDHKGRDASREDHGNMGRESFSQNFLNRLAESVDKAQATQAVYSSAGEEIIRQITEYIKLNIKPNTTEMELQLHPASLGNVKVQIASTEGVLTATFTTQNEAVKAALEAQLIQLKDNFAQQGLKVESIEVNVEAQGFERSLDQEKNRNQQYEENNKRNGRRIRLSALEGFSELDLEELDEADKVVADMMIRNGNTVDYTV
ncbi:MAG: flagellar hook-length control protein FliK [Lachnospiraceae bacterium]|nr:flagellar hook-length control protein FliK [Lachnospiraceae bacterium]